MSKRKRQLKKNKSISLESMDNNENNNKKSFLDTFTQPEIMVALGIVGLYVFTYAYYSGYYYSFHIPIMYLDLNLNKLTAPGLLYVTIILLLFIPNYIFHRYSTTHKNNMKKKGISPFIVFLLVVALLFIAMYPVSNLLELFYHLNFGHRDVSILITFYLAILGVTLYITDSFTDHKESTTLNIIAFFSIFIFLFLISFLMGAYSTKKVTYPILMENGKPQQKIILDTYKDFYVTSSYKKVKNGYQLTGVIELVDIKNNESINPIEVLLSDHKYKLNYEKKTIQIKEVPIKNLIRP
jgi:hypothetical protein